MFNSTHPNLSYCFYQQRLHLTILIFAMQLLMLVSTAESGELHAKPLNLEEILDAYCESQGGLEAIDQVKSIRMDGTIKMGDELLRFVQTKKQPNLVRLIIAKNDLEFILGYNGTDTWQILPGQSDWTPIAAEQATGFIREAQLFGHLVTAKKNDYRGAELIGETTVDDEPVYQIRYTFEPGDYADYFLSQETFYEVKLVYHSTHSDSTVIKENYFSDYFNIGKIVIPGKITAKENGVVESITHIDNARLNIGIFNAYFDPPPLNPDTHAK